MKKDYLTPEFEKLVFSFESILDETGLNVSKNEHGSSDHSDDDEGDW